MGLKKNGNLFALGPANDPAVKLLRVKQGEKFAFSSVMSLNIILSTKAPSSKPQQKLPV